MMVFEHTMATMWIWLGVLGAVGLGAFSVWRWAPRTRAMGVISLLHVLFLFLLLWCLLMPGHKTLETRTLKPRFIVALDTSKSMLLTPQEGLSNRWARAQEILAMPWVERVGDECDIDLYGFDGEVGAPLTMAQLSELRPEGESTLLRDALQKITARYAGMQVAGGVLLSDGVDTREAFDDWATEARPIALHTIQLEADAIWAQEPDLRIDTVQTPKRVTIDWQTQLNAVVSGQGTRGAVTVQLFKDGVLQQEMPIQIPADGGTRRVAFDLRHPEMGIHLYRLVLPPLPGESNTNDNTYAVSVQVIDARNRLLYVEGPPRWESKYLKRALLANTEVTPLVFLQGPGGKPMSFGAVGSMTADMTAQQLSFFKIVVIGNFEAEELGDRRANNLIRYVEAGGSLVLLGGSRAWSREGFAASPLKAILPVKSFKAKAREGEFAVALTDTGRAHPAFAGDPDLWEILPPVLSVFPDVVPAQAARILVEAQTPEGVEALILSQNYGQGKVVAIFTDSLWKWKLHPQAIATRPYQRFWDQLISWMLPAEDEGERDTLTIMTDKETLVLGESIQVSARLGTDAPLPDVHVRCEIELPGGDKAPFSMRAEPVTTTSGKTYPGFVTRYTATAPGLYTVTATAVVDGISKVSEPLSFFVKSFSAESTPRGVNADVLRSIAQGSRGRFFKDADALNNALMSLNVSPVEEETSEHHTLWQTWLVIACLALLATVSWVLRKVNNMP
ncbi:MAG: hypothetical protein HN919_21985 [Verrucomicrobia bacterium]|jgi:hypothetical protein|nr:hypothetical protein [Verrucomicrobiota bacterium]MBT7068983.1 hypothetical protein [Verrucomicrobiota bacterium]MBT7700958.1 hypothetical protein [Verrucomicrobiota bacterium]